MKSKEYYLDRAAYMKRLAKDAQTEKLRESCLLAAKNFEKLAQEAGEKAKN